MDRKHCRPPPAVPLAWTRAARGRSLHHIRTGARDRASNDHHVVDRDAAVHFGAFARRGIGIVNQERKPGIG